MAIQKEIPQDPRDAGKNTFAPVIDIATQTKVSPQEKVRQDEEGLSILDRRTTIISEKRRKRKSRLLKWGLGITASAAIVGAGVGIVNAVSSNNQIDSNTLPTPVSEPSKLPIIVPVVETPENIMPKSFTTTEITEDNGGGKTITTTTGVVIGGVNTTPLTKDNLKSIIENNPDSHSRETRDPHVMTNKHIFIAVESDKPVVVESSIGDIEVLHSDNDDGSNAKLIRYVGAGGTRLTFQGTGVLKLFTPNPVEVFQRPPFIVNGEKYLEEFFVIETTSDGEKLVYMIMLGGDHPRVDTWKLSDNFKNAPEATIFSEEKKLGVPNVHDAKNGIKAEMRVDADGNIIAPSLLEIIKPGTQVDIIIFGNIKLDPYLAMENGDTKVVKPS